MLIFSKLRFGSSRSIKASHSARGFTLIELIIAIAIIGILSAVTLARFSVFDSTVLLKSAAYEVATNIREAQVFAVSVLGAETEFDRPYGLAFTPDYPSYLLFQFVDPDPSNPTAFPYYNEDQIVIRDYKLERDIALSDVCVTVGGVEDCDIDWLVISFRRPEFTALIRAEGYSNAENRSIESAQIKLQSPKGNNTWVVEVGVLGHISVTRT